MSNRPPYNPPAYGKAAFHCPHCGVRAQQFWSNEFNSLNDNNHRRIDSPVSLAINVCSHCNKTCLWLNKELAIPNYHGMPPNDDMSDDIKKIYEEAGSIAQQSPRAAAALLRLALEMLCKDLGGEGKTINERIKSLIDEEKLSAEVAQSMNAVRLTGNKAAHPSEIDFNDNSDVVNILFELINFIAEEALTKPRERAEHLAKIKALTDKTTEQED